MRVQYSSNDPSIPPREKNIKLNEAHDRALKLLIKKERLLRAERAKVSFMDTKIMALEKENLQLRQQLEILQATAAFIMDGEC